MSKTSNEKEIGEAKLERENYGKAYVLCLRYLMIMLISTPKATAARCLSFRLLSVASK